MAKYKRQKVKRYRRSFYSRGTRIKKGIGIVVLVLAVLGWRLYVQQGENEKARAEHDAYAQQVETLKQDNEALRADIAEGATDEKMEELARNELGWTDSNEYVFYDKSN